MALYTIPSANVYVAEIISSTFHITNGTRQGCPLSPLIFDLAMKPLAEHIRTSNLISGFQIGGKVHKISLFADDVILMLTNPHSSLTAAQAFLNKYSKVSYYRVNASKSHILNLGIDSVTKNLLSLQFPFQWSETSLAYLGITLTKNIENLFKANYIPFKQKLIKSLEQISKHEFSWTGRIAAFKMTILPQLLYVFHSLHIPIPCSYLSSLQSILSKFIWKGKKPQVARAWLTMHRSVGGSGLVDIADYDHSTVLAQLKECFLTEAHSLWGDLECCLIPGRNLKLWLYSLHPKSKSKHLPPTILASVRTW